MATIKIAAIMRAGAFSPNHIGNDATILNNVAEQLRKRGCEVTIYTEEQFIAGDVTEDIIINMCRELRSTELLQALEDHGALVINSGYGIENCIRERQARIFLGSNIPYPPSLIVRTDEAVRERLEREGFGQCWIKRGDYHAQHKEDVSYVRRPQQAQEVIQEYFLRGISRVVISKHLPGDAIKFYGVAGTDFFHWFYTFDADGSHRTPQEAKALDGRLRDLCLRAAKELGVVVFGGECIESADGSLSIIDFNDWPTFAPCREEAAPAIAKAVMRAIRQRAKKH